jgi:uncharacterized protein (TIGR03437 family)
MSPQCYPFHQVREMVSVRLVRLLLLESSVVVSVFGANVASGFVRPDLVFMQRPGSPKALSEFVAETPDCSIVLTGSGARLISYGTGQSAAVSMRLVNGAKPTLPQGADPSSAKMNYFIGPESQWQRSLPTYSTVRFDSVYRGVDLLFHGHRNQLEHDFVIAAGSDPSVIQVEWTGARQLRLDDRGDLIVFTAGGQIRWSAPYLYQRIGGVDRSVKGAYKLLGGNRVGFKTGPYDRRFPLVIDPTLVFSTFVGGSRTEFSRGIAVDSSGNVYVTGHSNSIDLPVTKGAYQTGLAGSTADIVTGDVFVAKYSPSGSLLFLTYLGGQRDDIAMGLALDTSGAVYITGYTNSSDFPVTKGVLQSTFGGYTGASFILSGGDAFVSKLSNDGSMLLYSTYLGGSDDDEALGIAVDSSGDAFVTGMTRSNNFPVSSGAYQAKFAGSGGQSSYPAFGYPILGGDAFVAKLNPGATTLLYSTYLGGAMDDVATTVAVDASGNAYIGGFTLSFNFPVTAGVLQRGFAGKEMQNYFFNLGDGFITKVNPAGTALVYSTYVGGRGDDVVSSLIVDAVGNVYATGGTTSTNFPVTTGASQSSYAGPTLLPYFVDQLFGDAFVLKLNPAGTGLVFSTYFGGSGDDFGMSVASDGAGDLIVVGFSDSTNLPVTSGAVQTSLHGPGPSTTDVIMGDAFLAEFSPAGSRLYGTYLGGTSNDAGLSVAVSSSGVATVAGFTISPDFPVSKAAQSKYGGPIPTHASGGDGFVAAVSGFAAQTAPVVSGVVNAAGGSKIIAQNTFLEIFGTNLAPDTRAWEASDFVNGQMPTELDHVSVTVNGKPAFVNFISGTQVNVLTPLDSTVGNVQIVLTNAGGPSAPITAQEQSYSLGFFQYLGVPYVAATHVNGTLIGPASLYPGYTTPAKPGEIIVLYGDGFGQTTPPIVNGSATQFASLPSLPEVTIGGVSAKVQFAGVVALGLYQFNVVVPATLPNGDAAISATYNGFSTQSGASVTIHQ